MLERKDILKLAKLSRLDVSDTEVESMQKHLETMLSHLEEIRSLDLSAVEPMTSVDEPPTALRADVVGASLSHGEAFRNAPRVEHDHFVIPKVMG